MCPYLELFWPAFSRIRTEYGEIRSISLHSVQIQENADQNNSECGHFSRSFTATTSNAITKKVKHSLYHFYCNFGIYSKFLAFSKENNLIA